MRQPLIPDRLKPGQRTAAQVRIPQLAFMFPIHAAFLRRLPKSEILGSNIPPRWFSFVVPASAGPGLAVRNASTVNPGPAKAGTTNRGPSPITPAGVHGPNTPPLLRPSHHAKTYQRLVRVKVT